jgi:AraC-like DNA-binding protein
MKQTSSHRIKKMYATESPGNVIDADYFYYDTAPSDHKELAIICGGYEKCAPDFDINRNNYPYYFIKYTLKGKGTLRIGSQTFPLKPGILTGFKPGTAHHYKADPENPMEHIFITFSGDESENLFEKSTLSTRYFVETAQPDETLNMFNKILHAGHTKQEFSQDICCSYLRILLLEQASRSVHSKMHTSISTTTYQDCKKHIDAHFSSIKSPRQVADKCGIDVRYLSALFKRYGHISPSQYLMGLKLNKAANLLLTTDLAIKNIAFRIGFEDPYHFSKNFKKFHGRSPNNYRRKHM